MLCLTSVCLTTVTYIGPKSRTERPRKNKIGTEVAHVTRDSDTTFRVKRSKVKVTRPVYSPRHLRTQAAAAVSVGTYCAWETAATLPCAGAAVGSAARGATAPTEEERGGGISCRHAHGLVR